MVEAAGPFIGEPRDRPEGTFPADYSPIKEAEEIIHSAERQEAATPLAQADQWYRSEMGRLQAESDSYFRQLEEHSSNHSELLTKVVELHRQREELSRADCPDIKPKERELIETQEEIEALMEHYSTAHHLLQKSHEAGDEHEAEFQEKEVERLNREIKWHLDHLIVLNHDLKRDNR